jgi:N-acetyl-beta-hexosaminidase
MMLHLSLLGAMCCSVAAAPPLLQPPIVPLPASASSGASTRPLAAALRFTVSGGHGSADLQAAIGRYRALIYAHGPPPSSDGESAVAITTVDIAVKQAVRAMELRTDESYSLRVPATGSVTIAANTTVGAYRALETLSQLVEYDFDHGGSYSIRGAPWTIDDRPRFPWRGLMIDTSRHFLPVRSILRTLDAMSYSKLSVLHWHLVDRESFPLVLESVPELSQGAWSAQEKYSASDVKQIVEHARLRGIRVVPEIDLPTHTASWCVGMPDLCPHKPVVWNATHKGGRFDCGACSPCEPLDPTNPDVFTVLTKVFTELASLFPDAVFHQGADEVLDPAENNFAHIKCWLVSDCHPLLPPLLCACVLCGAQVLDPAGHFNHLTCWQSSPRIHTWLQKKFPGANARHGDNAYVWFVDQIAEILLKLKKIPMLWDDPYRWPNKTLASSTIVQAYRAKDACALAADQGHGVVVSPMGVYYLRGDGATWQHVYDWEPFEYCQ